MTGTQPLDAATLLGIDLGEELRKVPGAAVADEGHLTVELVRWLAARGARRVALRLVRGSVAAVAPGASVVPGTLAPLARLRDSTAPSVDRHAALAALEAGDPLLLALAAPAAGELSIEDARSGEALTTEGGPRSETRRDDASVEAGLRVRLVVRGLRTSSVRPLLTSACRHAPIPISLDGAPLPRGFGDARYGGRLPSPTRAEWALGTAGEVTHVDLLVHGVLAARVSLASPPGLRVALELGPCPPGAAAARTAFEPLQPRLAAALEHALLDAGAQLARLPSDVAGRLGRVLLELAARAHTRARLQDLPLLRTWTPRGTRYRSLRDLQARIAASPVPLPAASPGDPPETFAATDEPVWLLDARERAVLGELAGARFEPQPRVARAGWRGRLVAACRRLARESLARLRRPGLPLPEAALRPEERTLARALRDARPRVEPVFSDGDAPPTRRGSRLLLPRRHPDVARALRWVRSRPESAYPAALALGCPGGSPARDRWRASLAGRLP